MYEGKSLKEMGDIKKASKIMADYIGHPDPDEEDINVYEAISLANGNIDEERKEHEKMTDRGDSTLQGNEVHYVEDLFQGKVRDITDHLSFNGGNALNALVFSCHIGAVLDSHAMELLEAARTFIQREIKRVKSSEDVSSEVKKDKDAINPGHYRGFTNGTQVIDVTKFMNFNGGNAMKYLARSCRLDGSNKGAVLEDLNKALWYVDCEINRFT